MHAGIPPPDQARPPDQAHPLEQTPPRQGTPQSRHPPPAQCILGDTVNKRSVCILLECNLVTDFITARKRSLEQGNVSTHVCHSVPGGGWGWLPSMHHRSYYQHRGGGCFLACITGHMISGVRIRGGGFAFRGQGAWIQGGSVSKEEGVCIQWGWVDPPSPPSSAGTRKAGGRILLECFLVVN